MKSLLVTLLMAGTLFAQGLQNDRDNFQQLHVYGNFNLAKMTIAHDLVADATDVSNKMGFGVGVETVVGPLNFGFGYAQRGATYKADVGNTTVDGYDRLNYLTLHALLPFGLTPQFAALVGVDAGLSLGGETDVDGDVTDIQSDEVNYEFGARLGAEYMISQKMTARATYYLGLSDVLEDLDSDMNQKNRVITFTLLYRVK